MFKAENLIKRFPRFELAADFLVASHERLAIYSPSGTGKSTLLRVIAGLEKQDAGSLILNGRSIQDLAPEKRNIGFVFQDYALFPGKTAIQNVAYPLRLRGIGESEQREVAMNFLKNLGLSEEKMHQSVDRFSGGEKQRVAFARALSFKPDLILLDEPFAALDGISRHKSRELLLEMHARYPVPLILVTHDEVDLVKTATHTLSYETITVAQDKEIHRFFR
jgi:ABC-type Fe3+/spermidine/putrescine transport system ATPase subunit